MRQGIADFVHGVDCQPKTFPAVKAGEVLTARRVVAYRERLVAHDRLPQNANALRSSDSYFWFCGATHLTTRACVVEPAYMLPLLSQRM
jgi:hypothetical protein